MVLWPWRRTAGVEPDAIKVASPVLNGEDEETGRKALRLVLTQRSCRSSDEVRCRLCYDAHHLWRVPVVVTLPEPRPGVFRGGSGTSGHGQGLTRMVAPSPVLWDRATSVSLKTLFGCATQRSGNHAQRETTGCHLSHGEPAGNRMGRPDTGTVSCGRSRDV